MTSCTAHRAIAFLGMPRSTQRVSSWAVARASMLTPETAVPWCAGGITGWSSSDRMSPKPANRWPVASCIWACAVPMWAVRRAEASASRPLKSASAAPLTTATGVRVAQNRRCHNEGLCEDGVVAEAPGVTGVARGRVTAGPGARVNALTIGAVFRHQTTIKSGPTHQTGLCGAISTHSATPLWGALDDHMLQPRWTGTQSGQARVQRIFKPARPSPQYRGSGRLAAAPRAAAIGLDPAGATARPHAPGPAPGWPA